jgi:hypothetical protein
MRPFLFAGIAVCLFLSGCDDTKNPLSDPQKSRPDTRLIGMWRLSGAGDDEEFYHVGYAGDGFPKGMVRIVDIKHGKGKLESPEEYLAFPTVIADKIYLNVIYDKKQVQLLDEKGWKADVVASYTLFKCQIDGDKLVVFFMDEEAKEKAIKDGKIKGVHGNNTSTFTDSSENVARFITTADASLWDTKEPGRFERLSFGKKP